MLIFVDIVELKKEAINVPAMLLSGILFGLYHFSIDEIVGRLNFPWPQFAFLASAGIYLAGLFVLRGFGVAVGAHIIYNCYAFVSSL